MCRLTTKQRKNEPPKLIQSVEWLRQSKTQAANFTTGVRTESNAVYRAAQCGSLLRVRPSL